MDKDDSEESEKVQKRKYRKCGLKFSRNLLYNVYGHMAGNIYNRISHINSHYQPYTRTIELNANLPLLKQAREFFEKKGNGFYQFMQKFIHNRKNILGAKVDHIEEQTYSLDKIMNSDNYLINEDNFPQNQKNRYLTMKRNEVFEHQNLSAIRLQSHIRGHLAKKHFMNEFKEIIKMKTEKLVICIQTNYRRYWTCRRVKLLALVELIFTQRKLSADKIIQMFIKFKSLCDVKKENLIQTIILQRENYLIKLQCAIRTFLIKLKVKKTLEKEKSFYTLIYPFIAKRVRLIVYLSGGKNYSNCVEEKVYNFSYCNFRDLFILYIDPKDFKPGKYRVRMIVDNHVTCDGRFPHIEFSDGQYYNIIDFNLPRERLLNSLRETDINTHPESIINEEMMEQTDSMLDGSVKNCSNATYSNNSFLGELRKEIPLNEIDNEMVRNLANKEHHSYIELLKASIENNNIENRSFIDNDN